MDNAPEAMAQEQGVKMKRTRPRITSFKIDPKVVVERVIKFYNDDNQDRSDEIDRRLQRYAKYRMWTEGKNWPWENATDFANPDMMTASMRLQDTLHNAVMQQRPPVMAKATKKTDQEKEGTVDNLIDYQVFVEQSGEETIGTLAHDFVNEGFFTAYVPWVKETRHVIDVFVLPPIPDQAMPGDYFKQYLEGKYPRGQIVSSKDGWDWTITPAEELDKTKPKKHRASFYTKDTGEIEAEIEMEALRYDGPKVISVDVQDLTHPARCENLQIPGPSNPLGATHATMRSFPSIDEIQRLRESGYYDLLKDEDADKLGLARMDVQYQDRELQKDIMQGQVEYHDKPKEAKSHEKLTRLMCFDCYDVDGDGLDEDVIWWVILETKTLLKAKYLTEMFPSNPPMRPFAEAHLFPVPGRRFSIGLLEMMEGVHDLQKQFFDQGGDAGTIANAPFFFYRASSNMRPETIRLWPGEGYPLSDPQRDVQFPQIGNQNQSFTFNMVALLTQMEEKLTNIGDLQLGRVPQGKSSALRTVSGMQTVLSQGDARPERVLRRFFIGLTQIWKIIHGLNQVFLPKNKQFLISGFKEPVNDPYGTVTSKDRIAGSFMFDFSANALNTSKDAMAAGLQELMTAYVSPLAIQLGLAKPDGIYRLLRDYGRARGQDPDKYLTAPTPGAMLPPILFEEAMTVILSGHLPEGSPVEGTGDHLKKLQDFVNSDEFGLLDAEHIPIFRAYYEKVAKAAFDEKQQATLMQAAQQMGQGMQKPGLPGPAAGPQAPQSPTQLQGAELADEALPGAGGGANAVAA